MTQQVPPVVHSILIPIKGLGRIKGAGEQKHLFLQLCRKRSHGLIDGLALLLKFNDLCRTKGRRLFKN